MKKLKIYLATSWRNPHYETVLGMLREAGHEVYDFRNPKPGLEGFRWSECGLDVLASEHSVGEVTLSSLAKSLDHPRAQEAYLSDFMAIKAADVLVMLLPCGKSAHWELGAASAMGKVTVVCTAPGDGLQPELMYMSSRLCSYDKLLAQLAAAEKAGDL